MAKAFDAAGMGLLSRCSAAPPFRPPAAKDPRLKERTLTELYNDRPTWQRLAYEAIDRAVLAAYAAADPEGVWQEDWAKLWLDTGEGKLLPADHPLSAGRVAADQAVLANLLRMNVWRAGP